MTFSLDVKKIIAPFLSDEIRQEIITPDEINAIGGLEKTTESVAKLKAFLNDPAEFGMSLAGLLERSPPEVTKVVNNHVIYYNFLQQIKYIVDQFKIDLIIDVGANSGQYACPVFFHCDFKGEIHSYEPINSVFQILEKNLSMYPRWSIFNCALGDKAGKAMMNIGGDAALTSSFLPQTSEMDKFAPNTQAGNQQETEIKRIDDLYADILEDKSRRVMLKLDVQGFEEHVLRSCGKYLESFKVVQMELASIPMYEGDLSIRRALDIMESAGYALIYVSNNYPVKPGIYVDYDFIFCRADELKTI